MATINLGNIKFNWKGTYNAGTAYAIDDVVSYNGSSYIAKTATTGNLPTVTANWDIMSSAGTNGTDGTDVGATLANKEIAFKTNAGALDGIPIGTAGQFLKVNSGATGYEYGAVSSDFVKLAGVDLTGSSATSYSFTQFMDDSIYNSYVIKGNFKWSHSGAALRGRFLNNTTPYTGAADYSFAGNQNYRSGSATPLVGANAHAGKEYMQIYGWGASSSYASFFEVEIYGKPTTSGKKPGFYSRGWGTDNSGTPYVFMDSQGGTLNQTGTTDGIQLYPSGNTLDDFQATVWGLKK